MVFEIDYCNCGVEIPWTVDLCNECAKEMFDPDGIGDPIYDQETKCGCEDYPCCGCE